MLEAGDAVGGRVRTDHVDGYTLDRGFQVLNTGLPGAPGLVDLDALDLRAFDASVARPARRRAGTGSATRLQQPRGAAARARPPRSAGSRGKAALGAVRRPVRDPARRGLGAAATTSAPPRPGAARDIPPDVVNGLLRPFFSGVLLEQDLSTSRRFTDLMMRMFARGRLHRPRRRHAVGCPSSSPAGCPRAPSSSRPQVHRVGAGTGWRPPSGTRHGARAVVVATDAWTAARLLPNVLTEPRRPRRHHRLPRRRRSSRRPPPGCCSTPTPRRSRTRIVLSAAAPEYAPAGRALVSTSMVHGTVPDDPDGPAYAVRCPGCTAPTPRTGSSSRRYELPHALPGMPAPHPLRRPVRLTGGGETVYVAGDHRDTSSIQGALVSGRRAAAAVLADLRSAGMTHLTAAAPSTPPWTAPSCPATPRSATGCAGPPGTPTTRAPGRCAAGSWS